MTRILMVDDERRVYADYALALQAAGYEVVYRQQVDAAVDYIQREYKHIDLLLLDVMMPPGSKFDNGETRYGLRTGPRFFDFARSIIPMLPVVVFTNVTDEEVETYFQQQAHCWFLRKEEYFPRELAEFVQNALGAPVVGE